MARGGEAVGEGLGAKETVERARQLSANQIWTAGNQDAQQYLTYWFAELQADAIARLVTVIREQPQPLSDALAITLSRIIVTKEMMPSLARDASHSRPHRVSTQNRFDVYSGFLRSARIMAQRLRTDCIRGRCVVNAGDARVLDGIADESVDLLLTSPPYLNAIDYLRGHRLALVWFGYGLEELRDVRARSVGAERMISVEQDVIDVSQYLVRSKSSTMEKRHMGWVSRYARDMHLVLTQARRVIKKSGRVVMVVGDSILRGTEVKNAKLLQSLAEATGLQCYDREVRKIPARRRYLPPPGDGGGTLDARIRTETVLRLAV